MKGVLLVDKYTGKRLDGRYEIQELIGVGGMAMVYKAYDSVDDTTVAIKILKEEFLNNSDFIRRFKNESKAIAVLSHPNIVKVNDVSFGDKIQYIVMEYIDGITLKEYISHQHVIPWKEAVHFTVQILQALQHAHEKGIVHRDMKPQNIMLLQDGTIKVTDFGIARFADTETKTMTDKAIGSVHYIAPEQARGDATDCKADIYSVGIMLYEMLTGKLPFEADSPVSVAIMQMQDDPKPLREINPKVPEGIEEITLKAMRKNPSQRYASAKEMLEAIEIFRHNPSVKFRYNYYVDETPTKYVDSINKVPSAAPEPAYDDSYNSYDDELSGNVSRTIIKWLTVLVSLMVVAAIGFLIYMMVNNNMKANETKDVDVPQFVGMMYDEIQKDKSYKFKFDIEAEYRNDKPLNSVLSQDPEAGSKKVKENAAIKLVINSESTTVQVPKLKNYSEQEAIVKLESKFFNYTVVRVNSTELKKGYVIECSPQEGTNQEIGTNITLIVSDGPATEKVEVPNVSDLTFDRAKAELESKGFTTQKVSVASAKDEGKVVSTDPLPGNKLSKGSLINIQVSDGSKQQKNLKYEVELPEEEDAEITVTVFVDGKEDSSYSGRPAKGFKVVLDISPKGAQDNKKTVRVDIDNGDKKGRYAEYIFDFKLSKVTRTYLDTNYKVKEKESSNPLLDEAKEDARNQIESYVDLSTLSRADKDAVQKIIDNFYASIEDSTDPKEVYELLDYSKGLIDDKLSSSKPESSVEESSKPEESSTLAPDELEQARLSAIEEITNYANKYYYSDEEWALAEAILNEYIEKINASEDLDEIIALDIEAQHKLEDSPHSTSNGNSPETPVELYAAGRFDPDAFLIFR